MNENKSGITETGDLHDDLLVFGGSKTGSLGFVAGESQSAAIRASVVLDIGLGILTAAQSY